MNLASVQRVIEILPIPEADNIVEVRLLGWGIVCKKDEFQVGQLVSYIMIDTVVPETEQFEFLRSRKFRVRTIKLRKTLSQGLVVPLPEGEWKEGDDLTDILNIKKYEKPDNNPIRETKPKRPKAFWPRLKHDFKYHFLYRWFPKLRPKTRSVFPKHLVPITDEERIQNIPKVLEQYKGKDFIASYKLDGCLDEGTLLTTPNGDISIKQLFDSNYKGEILSRDIINNRNEFVKINQWLVRENIDNWYKITLEDDTEIIVTDNHPFWLDNFGCYRQTKDLIVGDNLLVKI